MIAVNPLDILRKRELTTMPPHFVKTKCSLDNFITIDADQDIRTWITAKLNGRFAIVKLPGIAADNKLKSIRYVGFEDHKELTYFMLACPHIRR